MDRVVGGEHRPERADDIFDRLPRQPHDFLTQQVLVLRSCGGEIPALALPDHGEGIGPEVRRAADGDAGVRVSHQRRQAHKVQEEFGVAFGFQPPLDLRFQRQEFTLRRVGEHVRVVLHQDRFIEEIQVLQPLLRAQRLRRQGRDRQQGRQAQPQGPPGQFFQLVHQYRPPLS